MYILGIESSCDETAAAVMENDSRLLSNIVNTQIDIHRKYGGVVPELASRKHLEDIYPVVDAAIQEAGITLDQIDTIAVTQGPGLIGSLLVGLSFAKAISLVKKIPYVGVDHMAGHLISVFLGHKKPEFPYIALVASGGHSSIFHVSSPSAYSLLGRTRDDAAGEAFDKVAKIIGLGYPGGPAIGALSKKGNPEAVKFPRSWLEPGSPDFSFSGIKTSVANYVKQNKVLSDQEARQPVDQESLIADICASFQEAVVDVLVEKTLTCALQKNIKTVVLSGGVSANIRLRQVMEERGHQKGLEVFMPPLEFCTDNAAMIALAGYYQRDKASLTYDMDVYSRISAQ
ncbi:MAG: tRNA (adenosine(37)-N6)-threonylcarbamoyltransferase complex transferase subunit TsaD [Desulfobulbaceae bacterium]|uniref:tRNA N6-adenosine threonylcarbamoyltransferase n=1 Tax=Candidatus Desulfobia pelagia TaxID=2841692 RepID=A0A8J6NEJ9_9BACT|nr:tRNA (adenosine(37)-N6)-threonylcarbamoyltransferase complex transferase subunit TsaD [Candidatus Desulfobia pelagia]